jgi:hypothetical protein
MFQGTSVILPKLDYEFEVVLTKDAGKVYLLPQEKIMITELEKSYVPITEFQDIFRDTIPIVREYGIQKFIFDKQQLRVFHQPSMEWYFLYWKTELYELGLSKHRKILPQDQPAFKLAVDAGKAKIMRENQDTIIPLLDIQYTTNIPDAIRI